MVLRAESVDGGRTLVIHFSLKGRFVYKILGFNSTVSLFGAKIRAAETRQVL
jgi:hypothetical protein